MILYQKLQFKIKNYGFCLEYLSYLCKRKTEDGRFKNVQRGRSSFERIHFLRYLPDYILGNHFFLICCTLFYILKTKVQNDIFSYMSGSEGVFSLRIAKELTGVGSADIKDTFISIKIRFTNSY